MDNISKLEKTKLDLKKEAQTDITAFSIETVEKQINTLREELPDRQTEKVVKGKGGEGTMKGVRLSHPREMEKDEGDTLKGVSPLNHRELQGGEGANRWGE